MLAIWGYSQYHWNFFYFRQEFFDDGVALSIIFILFLPRFTISAALFLTFYPALHRRIGLLFPYLVPFSGDR